MSLFQKLLSPASDQQREKVQAILQAGDQAYASGDPATAEQRYLETIEMARKLRAYSEAIDALFALAALHAQSDLAGALNDLSQCEETAKAHLSDSEFSRVLSDLGNAYINLDRLDLARARLEEGIKLDQKSGDVVGWVSKLMNLCALSRLEGRYADCYAMCGEGIQISETHKNGTAMITAYLRYADLLRDVFCAPDRARQFLIKVERLAPRYADGKQRIEFEYQQAYLQLRFGHSDAALQHLGKVALSARYNRQSDLLESAQFVLAEICIARQDDHGLQDVLANLHPPAGSRLLVKTDMLRTRLALHQARLKDAIEILERVSQQRGWLELERTVLLAVVEARFGVTDQARAYLHSADQTLQSLRRQIPVDFHDNLQRKPEVVEFEQVKGMVA